MTAKSAKPVHANLTVEHKRLIDEKKKGTPWNKWGPYLSERQWGTVREDYSQNVYANIHDPGKNGINGRRMASVLDETRLRRVLSKMLDKSEFLGPYGIRSVSRYHLEHPYSVNVNGQDYNVAYLPGESDSGMFGGNSNWRGPVFGGTRKFQDDAFWKDNILFYEYFHGDNGAGIGANHQTGWTGVVARILHLFASTSSEQTLELGKKAAFVELE
jgi:hypothetical protein